jgi:hypothetical protein
VINITTNRHVIFNRQYVIQNISNHIFHPHIVVRILGDMNSKRGIEIESEFEFESDYEYDSGGSGDELNVDVYPPSRIQYHRVCTLGSPLSSEKYFGMDRLIQVGDLLVMIIEMLPSLKDLINFASKTCRKLRSLSFRVVGRAGWFSLQEKAASLILNTLGAPTLIPKTLGAVDSIYARTLLRTAVIKSYETSTGLLILEECPAHKSPDISVHYWEIARKKEVHVSCQCRSIGELHAISKRHLRDKYIITSTADIPIIRLNGYSAEFGYCEVAMSPSVRGWVRRSSILMTNMPYS